SDLFTNFWIAFYSKQEAGRGRGASEPNLISGVYHRIPKAQHVIPCRAITLNLALRPMCNSLHFIGDDLRLAQGTELSGISVWRRSILFLLLSRLLPPRIGRGCG